MTQTHLSEERIQSSIPSPDSHWKYPSPKMFYDAMIRKGHSPNRTEMDVIVDIHNSVNEQTWQYIRQWEDDPEIKLVRFMGRPEDPSPKSIMNRILGYKRPFDRHDWWVQRRNGTIARYVIDFYPANVGVHIDARPAIDSIYALKQRIFHYCNWPIAPEK